MSAIRQCGRSGLIDQIVGAFLAELAPQAKDFLRLGGGKEDRATVDRADFVKTTMQGGHHAEVAAAPTNAPKQVLVLRSVSGQETAIGRNNVSANDVVNGKTEFAMQVAPAAAQCQSGNANGGNNALGGGQSERLSFAVKFTELQAGLRAYSAPGRVDKDAFHGGHVNHEAAVANCFAGNTMASSTNRNENLMLAGETYAGDDVGRASAAGDDRRSPINHGIGKGASLVIAWVPRAQSLPAYGGSELLNGGFRHHGSLQLDEMNLDRLVRPSHKGGLKSLIKSQ